MDAEEIDEVCCGVANLVDGPTGDIVRALGGDVVGDAPFAYANYQDFDPKNEIETRGRLIASRVRFRRLLADLDQRLSHPSISSSPGTWTSPVPA